ncbi:uncharacterized protein [Mycetomoellerius zeteki]|uniref:uncharacterized protein isoform X2 n=1 Tax=Mycetomoellerius zeteki TaxID=64791 RepID=UPI00084E7257|nr:PREDICTED: uncharacterized protein LOC108722042 isoform X2 [Trachymyrmex zeteki]
MSTGSSSCPIDASEEVTEGWKRNVLERPISGFYIRLLLLPVVVRSTAYRSVVGLSAEDHCAISSGLSEFVFHTIPILCVPKFLDVTIMFDLIERFSYSRQKFITAT